MKKIIVFLLLFVPTVICGQDTFEINLSITDTVIVAKKDRRGFRYAAKVNVEINVPNLQNTIFLYRFNNYVPTSGFFSDMNPFENYKNSAIGLHFIIEDKDQYMIIAESMSLPPPSRTPFVNSRQRIKWRVLNDIESRNYSISKYEIVNRHYIQ